MANLSARAQAVFPAGSNGEFNLPPELAIVIARGRGCELWDSAGRHFLDFSMGWGSVLVGHARPEVVEAVTAQAPQGSNYAYVTEASLALAEEILRVSPACEALRFCASGTEATMYCQRLARAFTGRPKILKFEGAYHGANEVGVTSLFPADPPDFPEPDPTGGGIGHMVKRDVLVAPYNDLETTRAIIDAHRHEIAGVIVEPLQRCTPPEPGFLEGLRDATRAADVLLLYDEVVTEANREFARDGIEPVLRSFDVNEIIQDDGRPWTDQTRSDVKTYWGLQHGGRQSTRNLFNPIIANSIFVFLLLLALLRAMPVLTRSESEERKAINVMLLIVCSTLVLGRVISYFESSGLVVPIMAGAILLTVLTNARIASVGRTLSVLLRSV
ncbi:MAG: aminotransferase class III-fold pyridoxal phosphate-dependent enzyme, partial [Proteobacteria bacterium]|nr:aminotransferase class III-fold pyridoxal phosphate-dependent enzyme [Pseudomonadota bacterium]